MKHADIQRERLWRWIRVGFVMSVHVVWRYSRDYRRRRCAVADDDSFGNAPSLRMNSNEKHSRDASPVLMPTGNRVQ